MAMKGNDRGDAVYNMLAAQPAFNALNGDEKLKVQTQLRAVWAADLAYVQGNADVTPSTLQNPSGQPVATTGGPAAQSGTTTAPATLIGLGKIL